MGDGNIAVISGLKLATTGDTLVHSGSVDREAEKKVCSNIAGGENLRKI